MAGQKFVKNALIGAAQRSLLGSVAGRLLEKAHLHCHLNDCHCGSIIALERALKLAGTTPSILLTRRLLVPS